MILLVFYHRFVFLIFKQSKSQAKGGDIGGLLFVLQVPAWWPALLNHELPFSPEYFLSDEEISKLREEELLRSVLLAFCLKTWNVPWAIIDECFFC